MVVADRIAELLEPATTPTRGFYSPQLDGLRFLAAFAVFAHHSPEVPGLGALKTYGWARVERWIGTNGVRPRTRLMIGVSILSYNVCERPFLKLKKRFTVVRSRPI